MSRENFFNILELPATESNESLILNAIKNKQAEWSKLRNHPSKGRIAQKNLSLLNEIKKVMLDDNLRSEEAKKLLNQDKKDRESIEKEVKKQIELLSSKGKIYKSEFNELKKQFSDIDDIKDMINVKIVDDEKIITKSSVAPNLNNQTKFLDIIESSTLQKIESSLNILNKRDLYHFLGVKESLPIPELKKVIEKKYLDNNKSASKTAEVTSTSELLGMIKSIVEDPKRKELYDNSIILKKLNKLDKFIEISGKNGVIEREEYLFIYEEGVLTNIDENFIKKYIDFYANNHNIKVILPDFTKPLKFRNQVNNETQLFELIRNKETRNIEDLLKNNTKIDINKKNEHGSTPLILATYSGELKIVKILVENGANVNLAGNDGSTPLIWATVGENTQIIRYLLNQNINIDTKDKHGFTPLMWAASKTNETLVKIFLDYNADTQIKNNNGETAYDLAKKAGNIRLFYIIKDYKGGDKTLLKENIFKAIDSNDLIFLGKQYGINFNQVRDENENNILHLSIQKGKRDIIEWILTNNKVNINDTNKFGNTTLTEAIIKKDDITISNLLKKNTININKGDENGFTPLMHSINIGDIYIIKTLLKYNAKLETEDNTRNRALTIAVWQNKREIVGLLIDYGAKTDIINKSGKSLMDLAKDRNNQEMIDYLSVYISDNTPTKMGQPSLEDNTPTKMGQPSLEDSTPTKKGQPSLEDSTPTKMGQPSLEDSTPTKMHGRASLEDKNKASSSSKDADPSQSEKKKEKEKKPWWKFW